MSIIKEIMDEFDEKFCIDAGGIKNNKTFYPRPNSNEVKQFLKDSIRRVLEEEFPRLFVCKDNEGLIGDIHTIDFIKMTTPCFLTGDTFLERYQDLLKELR